jgi:hypothetical protein
MTNKGKKLEPPLRLDMSFDEALDMVHLRGHGYWLKDRLFDPAAYRPDGPFEDTKEFN